MWGTVAACMMMALLFGAIRDRFSQGIGFTGQKTECLGQISCLQSDSWVNAGARRNDNGRMR
jgi:hypothetical protein